MSQERLLKILLGYCESEKSTRIAEKQRQFTFKVIMDANKIEIKKAVESLFKVKVLAVRTLRTKSKERRFKQVLGYHKPWKKAYITLAEGYTIDLLSATE